MEVTIYLPFEVGTEFFLGLFQLTMFKVKEFIIMFLAFECFIPYVTWNGLKPNCAQQWNVGWPTTIAFVVGANCWIMGVSSESLCLVCTKTPDNARPCFLDKFDHIEEPRILFVLDPNWPFVGMRMARALMFPYKVMFVFWLCGHGCVCYYV